MRTKVNEMGIIGKWAKMNEISERRSRTDGCAIDEARIHAAAIAQTVSDRTHGQHNVQVAAHAVDEEAPQVLRYILYTGLNRWLAHGVQDTWDVVAAEQIRHCS